MNRLTSEDSKPRREFENEQNTEVQAEPTRPEVSSSKFSFVCSGSNERRDVTPTQSKPWRKMEPVGSRQSKSVELELELESDWEMEQDESHGQQVPSTSSTVFLGTKSGQRRRTGGETTFGEPRVQSPGVASQSDHGGQTVGFKIPPVESVPGHGGHTRGKGYGSLITSQGGKEDNDIFEMSNRGWSRRPKLWQANKARTSGVQFVNAWSIRAHTRLRQGMSPFNFRLGATAQYPLFSRS